MKLDIGCGQNKQPGFTGVDRTLLQGVDIVCDINYGLPFADNSVDGVMASHVLEHVDELIVAMEDVYRVCKHKSIVCILAPYAHTSLNMANPYHKYHFNEHTPRFFTKSNYCRVPVEEYTFPFITQWGLGESENNKLNMDFRCIRMEFFYFHEYVKLPLHEKRKLRRTQMNIVDQIMYHFVVVKAPISEQELDDMASSALEVPAFVKYRKEYESTFL